MNGHIYIVRNLINGKGYVGQTIFSVERRFAQQKSYARSGKPGALNAAIRLYGEENFAVTRLVTCDQSLLNELEIYFIRACNTQANGGYGYNLTIGGDGGVNGAKHPPRSSQWLERQRKAKIGKFQTAESNRKRSLALKNRSKPPRTAEHKKHMSLAKKGQNKGVPWSPARRAAYEAGKK